MFKTALLSLLISEVAAGSFAPKSSIDARSSAGRRILSNAKRTDGRELNDANNAYIAGMELKYTGCYNLFTPSEEGGEEGSGIANVPVITFSLYKDGKSVGNYATEMLEFLDSYTESTLQEQEWKCESYRENVCEYECQNNNNEYCQNNCFTNAGMTECVENENGQEEFEVQRYLECQGMDMEGGNQNGYNGQQYNGQQNGQGNINYQAAYQAYPQWDGEYKIGPYCAADGKSIYLGVFYDDTCTVPVSNGASVYSSANWGQSLPYASTTLIPANTAISCVDNEAQQNGNGNGNQQNQYNNANGNNGWYNMEPSEFCMQAYEGSAKCENSNAPFYTTTTAGCDFINTYLPSLSSSTPFHLSRGSGSKTAVVFAWLFAITTLMFGGYAYFLYRKIKRGGAGLSSQDGGAMA